MPTRPGDKWGEGRLKIGGRVVLTRRFDTKRAATDCECRQCTTFDECGYDPSSGKIAVETLLAEWLEQREGHVSETTLKADRFLKPTARQLSGVSKREPVLPTWFRRLHVSKVNASTITKRQGDLAKRGLAPTTVGREARATLVKHFTHDTHADVAVVRNQSVGSSVMAPKSGKGRNLPVPDYLVPLTTVQAWLGHGSIQVTARYLHHLGDYADRAALDVLNKVAVKGGRARTRKLPDLSSFGTSSRTRQAPERGRGIGL